VTFEEPEVVSMLMELKFIPIRTSWGKLSQFPDFRKIGDCKNWPAKKSGAHQSSGPKVIPPQGHLLVSSFIFKAVETGKLSKDQNASQANIIPPEY